MDRSIPTLPSYVNGRFVELGRPEMTCTCFNPAAPSDTLATIGWSRELIPDTIEGLKQAQRDWATRSLEERLAQVGRFIGYLRENCEELKSQMSLELARSHFTVDEEWRACELLFSMLPEYCLSVLGEQTGRRGWRSQAAPVGLVLISSTVALPVYSLLSAMLPALVAGNAVAVRPSKHAVLSASILVSTLHQTGFPPGLIQWIYGDFHVYRRLVLTHEFNVVLYSGGEESREQLRKDLFTYPDTRLVQRIAGKNAALVLESADLERAVERTLYGVCADAGQRFEATGLAFVHKSVAGQFVEAMVEAVKALPTGVRMGLDSADRHVMGPLCSNEARERFLRFQGIAYRESQDTLRWGKSIDNPGNGFYVSPGVHLISPANVLKSVYAKSAIFGPDLAIVPVDTVAEAVEIYDRLDSGDILAVHSATEEEVQVVRRIAECPRVFWGSSTTLIEPDFPTGTKGNPAGGGLCGLDFLLSTVFPKVYRAAKDIGPTLFALLVFLGAMVMPGIGEQTAHAVYRKAVEGNDVVKGKFYPRRGRFQFNLLQGGSMLNQAFIDTYLVTGSALYHVNEWHAVGVEAFLGFSNDRGERQCVESFMFDEQRATAQGAPLCSEDVATYDPTATVPNEPKPASMDDEEWRLTQDAGIGPFLRKPGYMPIRQIDRMFGAVYQWTPVYGKALWFLSYVGYLDIFGSVGVGVAQTTFWPKQNYVPGGTPSSIRGDECVDQTLTRCIGTTRADQIGVAGRPAAVSDMPFVLSGGLGSRFYVGRIANGDAPPSMMFVGNLELRNFSLVSMKTEEKFMNVFGLWGGLGILF